MELPVVNLKVILLVHWLLTVWGCLVIQGGYAWANFTVLALGVWAVAQRDSIDAISMFLGGLLATILLDIIYISIFYPRNGLSDTTRFGAGMAILSLLLKPFSCYLVHHMYRERGGEFHFRSDFLGPSLERSAYETIDSSEAPADPFAEPERRVAAPHGYQGQANGESQPGSLRLSCKSQSCAHLLVAGVLRMVVPCNLEVLLTK
ncbi:type-1 angiotensin II receptor-associated protein [Ctenodactylus gundi]